MMTEQNEEKKTWDEVAATILKEKHTLWSRLQKMEQEEQKKKTECTPPPE